MAAALGGQYISIAAGLCKHGVAPGARFKRDSRVSGRRGPKNIARADTMIAFFVFMPFAGAGLL
jgi:hypothetical protein